MGTMSVSLVDVSNPGRKEEGKTDRRKEEREEGIPFDENEWVLGRGDKFRIRKIWKGKSLREKADALLEAPRNSTHFC